MAPAKSLALVGTAPGVVAVKEVATPTISKPNEIIVKTHAVALNPTDWKHRDGLLPVDATLGCDFAGVVDAVGADVTNVKVGDRVASFVHGGRYVGVGSFAQYIQTEGSLVWKVPANIPFEEAAALGGVGPHTAFQALYLRLAIPHPSTPATSPQSIFIYGGSTSVGLYAIQLAKLSGLHVITCCSPRNNDLVKSLGADEVVDYNDASAPAQLKAKHPTLALGFDCIAEKGSAAFIAKSFGGHGGKIVTLLPVQQKDLDGVEGIELIQTLAYALLGKAFDFPGWMKFEANPVDKAALEKWLLYVPSIIADGRLKSNPLLHHPGSLEAINDGLEQLKAGKTSAQKIVYTIV